MARVWHSEASLSFRCVVITKLKWSILKEYTIIHIYNYLFTESEL